MKKKKYIISDEELALFSRYLNNESDKEERELIELKLKENSVFKEKLQEVQYLITGIKEANLKPWLDTVHQSMHKEKGTKKPSGKITRMKIWWAAAAAIVLIASAIWVFQLNVSPEEKFYSNFYKPDPGLPTLMSVSDNYVFDMAMVNYKLGEYDKAIEEWSGLLEIEAGNDSLQYFLANAYLAKNDFINAKAFFEKVTKKPESEFINESFWYLALIHIKEGNKEAARELIQKSNHYNKQKALEILK